MYTRVIHIKEYIIVIVSVRACGRLALECQGTLRVGPKVGTTVPKIRQYCDVFRQLASNDSQATSDKMSTETHEANTMQRRNLHELTQQHQRKHICRVTKILSFFLATVALYSVSFKHYHTFRGCMHVPRRQFLNESQYATAVATEIQFYFITIIFSFMAVVTSSRVGFGVASFIPDNFCTIRNRNELTQQHQRKHT